MIDLVTKDSVRDFHEKRFAHSKARESILLDVLKERGVVTGGACIRVLDEDETNFGVDVWNTTTGTPLFDLKLQSTLFVPAKVPLPGKPWDYYYLKETQLKKYIAQDADLGVWIFHLFIGETKQTTQDLIDSFWKRRCLDGQTYEELPTKVDCATFGVNHLEKLWKSNKIHIQTIPQDLRYIYSRDQNWDGNLLFIHKALGVQMNLLDAWIKLPVAKQRQVLSVTGRDLQESWTDGWL